MKVKITPSRAKGRVLAPPSKSMAHRLLILSAFAGGVSTIRNLPLCEDVLATLDCLVALGIRYELQENEVRVYGENIHTLKALSPFPCRESGSTLRFFIPIAALLCENVTLVGKKSLLRRPLAVYEELFSSLSWHFSANEERVEVCGGKVPKSITVNGSISSQFITGLLFMYAILGEGGEITLSGKVESRSYIDLTVSALSSFGVRVEWKNENTLSIMAGQKLCALDIAVEGDYSGAAFLEALNCLGGEVLVDGLSPLSLQGDRAYLELFPLLQNGSPVIPIGNIPDLGPILFTVAAAYNGATFLGTDRLKIKESDRAGAMQEELSKFGAKLILGEDTVMVVPATLHAPSAALSGHNDHRIVMSLSVLATRYGGEILDAEATAKSFPDFFEKITKLGIEVQTYDTE